MAAQPTDIDLRGKSLDEVIQALRKNGFSVCSTKISMWNSCPGPAMHVVWIEDDESHLLTVVILNNKIVVLEPGVNLHLSDRPEGLLPGQDWFTARTLDALA